MKNKLIRFGLAAMAAVALLVPDRSEAQGNRVSFQITNSISSAISYVSVPTNASGLSTGKAIGVGNYVQAGFTFYGQGNVTNVGNTVITLVRADTPNPPGAADWESNPIYTLTITNALMPTGGANNGTNIIVWHTNLDFYAIGPVGWIGISSITNTASGGGAITNAAAYLDTRIVPIRYP